MATFGLLLLQSAVLVSLLQFGSLPSAGAAAGATAFILVVVLTILASSAFDPGLMWVAIVRASRE